VAQRLNQLWPVPAGCVAGTFSASPQIGVNPLPLIRWSATTSVAGLAAPLLATAAPYKVAGLAVVTC
jgi:hypothetical protein